MQSSNRWIHVMLIIAGLLLAGCRSDAGTLPAIEAVHIESVAGEPNLHRVILTERAAERLDIQVAQVVEDDVIRKRRVGGEIVEMMGKANATDSAVATTVVRLNLNEIELNQIDQGEPVSLLSLDSSGEMASMTAQPIESPAADETLDSLYYAVESEEQGWTVGEKVFVELTLIGGGNRLIVPYSSLIYDLHGETWVYTSPEPLIYVRHPVSVDYIEGDIAMLTEGPSIGTEVVSAAVIELWGAETGVGGGH